MKQMFFLLFLTTTFIFSCKSEEKKKYEGCCDILPIQASLDTGNIYIPNIFTPNNDGINDFFFPMADGGIKRIQSLVIYNSNNEIVYEQENFIANFSQIGWNGLNSKNRPVAGLYDYEITVISELDDSQTLIGQVCLFICEEENFPNDNLPQCGFSAQHNGSGQWDTSLESHDTHCF